MPRMDQAPPSQSLIKQLLIGDGRIGKTHYAAEAAKHFNVLYINGDANTVATLRKQPVEVLRNIYAINVGDTVMGGLRDSKFIDFMQEFTTNIKVRWNDTEERVANRADTGEIWEITPSRMDHTCLLVLDSWTALVDSIMLQAARANNVILETASTHDMRPVYQSAGLKATSILQCIKALRCHVLVLAHPDEYEHKTAPEGRAVKDIKEKDLIVDWTKMIPKSTSKPHGMQIGRFFTDVGWMELSPAGTERRINFKAKNDRIAGGHFAECKSTTEYSFANLVTEVGGDVMAKPAPIDSWFNLIPALAPGETPVEAAPKVLDGIKPTGIAGLTGLGKKAAAA